jgi:hypothetical protein
MTKRSPGSNRYLASVRFSPWGFSLSSRTSIGVRYSPQAVTSNRNEGNRRCLALMLHCLFRGRPPHLRAMPPSVLLTSVALEVFGGRLRARRHATQCTEALVKYAVLNRMTQLGMPKIIRMG